MKCARIFVHICVVVGGLLSLLGPARAATIPVACDTAVLIAAINTANNNGAGSDTLSLAADCVYTLTRATDEDPTNPTGLPWILSTVEIIGNGATIERSKAPDTPSFRLFLVQSTGVLTLLDVTIRNGRTIDGLPQRIPQRRTARVGGGIANNGSLTLINCTVTGNATGNGADYLRIDGERGAGDGGDGGGIFNRGTLILTNSTVSGNTTGHGGKGIRGGRGGDGAGLINSNERGVHTMTLTNSTVSGNTAGDGGEGVTTGTGGPGGRGGGIYNHNRTFIFNSTITDNAAGKGGGGDIANGKDGTGGGIRNDSNSPLTLQNSIVAAQRRGKDCEGPDPVAYIHTLDSDNSCNPLSPPGAPLPPPLQLGPLQNNGGSTQTHPLLCGSPAIDAGNPAGCTDAQGNLLLTDQRGVERPQGNVCDIGAFEVQAGADLSLTQAVIPSLAGVGEPLTYRFAVTNQGPDAASDVTLMSSLPLEKASVTSVHASQGACTMTSALSCALGELACGQQATVEVVLVASRSGELKTTAVVQSDSPDPVIENNTHTEIVRVGSLVSLPELESDARVVVELLLAPTTLDQAVLTGAPPVAEDNIAMSGCNRKLDLDVTGTVLVNANKSLAGCRVVLDADAATNKIDAFPAGTVLQFSDFAGWEVVRKPLYPGVFHISWRPPGGGALDEALAVTVRLIQDVAPLPACQNSNSLDFDGDGLWDDWERFGIDRNDDGIVDLDLPAEGANPDKPDIFVHLDYMDCDEPGGDCAPGSSHSHEPKAAALAAVAEAFAQGGGSCGPIRLHFDEDSKALPHQNFLSFVTDVGENFATLKARSFGPNDPRGFAYHYGLFTHQERNRSTVSGRAEQLGNDFTVSFGGWNLGGMAELDGDALPDANVGTVRQQASTLMHELGHNLGLLHGGGDSFNRKPNYPSIMNYAFQLTGVTSSVGENPNEPVVGKLTFSAGQNASLDEEDLQETTGLCVNCSPFDTHYTCPYNAACPVPIDIAVATVHTTSSAGPIDWNCNGEDNDEGITADLNGDCESDTPLRDFDDWNSLHMAFQAARGFAESGGSSSGEDELDTVALNTWITSAKDSFLREGAPNANEGANPFLVVNSQSQALVGFALSQLPSPGVTSAKLRLTLAEAPRHSGKAGVTVQVYRLHESFTEGDDSNWGSSPRQTPLQENEEGVTWNCATDTHIKNDRVDCEAPWKGAKTALVSLTGTVVHPRASKVGDILELDVTTDVQKAIEAIAEGATEVIWLLKKKNEREPGQVIYFAKESALTVGEVSQAPSLFLKFD